MNKRRPGLLWLTIFVWIAYFISTLIFGFSVWFVKALSLASIILTGILLFYMWKYIEQKMIHKADLIKRTIQS